MTTLTVSEKGQVIFPQEVLAQLGVVGGGEIKLTFLLSGQCMLHSAQTTAGIQGITQFIGLLAGKSTKTATLEEIVDMRSCSRT